MARPQRHDTPRFHYQTLRGNEIRLLQIHPSSRSKRNRNMSDNPICCDLHHFPLVEPAPSGNLVARLAKTKSTWDISAHELGFRIVGKPKQYKSVFLKLKGVLSMNKARRSAINGRFPWGDYVALSYTWGNTDETSEIVVNGKPVKVRPNLECALRVLREKGPIRAGMKVWIDALCLNQMDTNEKNAQVPRMREIYQRALNVVVWLGPEAEYSDSAMRLIRTLAASWRADEGEALARIIAENPLLWHRQIDCEEGSLQNCWEGMRSLMRTQYWKRVWIVQELAMGGRESPLLHGDACVDFGEVCDATAAWMTRHARFISQAMLYDRLMSGNLQQRLTNMPDFRLSPEPSREELFGAVTGVAQLLSEIVSLGEIQNTDQWILDHDRITFIESVANRLEGSSVMCSPPGNLIALGRTSEASQPQDKIYGFLSLMDPKFSSQFKVDYNQNATEVYTAFSVNWTKYSKKLDLFTHCFLEHNHTPSWVPDWNFNNADSLPLYYIGEEDDGYLAGGLKTILDVQFSPDLKRMKTLGMLVDQIDGLTTADDEVPESIRQGSATVKGTFDEVRKALWQTFVGNRDHLDGELTATPLLPNENGESLLDVPLPKEPGSALPEPYRRSLYQFIETNQTFLINNLRLDQYFANSGQRIEVASETLPESSKKFDLRRQIFTASMLLKRRRLATTINGRLALVPRATKPGDIVAILVGCGQAVILRSDDDSFKVVGTSYVHGIMEGELLTKEILLENGCDIWLS